MSVDIYMYAEARHNGDWALCAPPEPLLDEEYTWWDPKAIYAGEQYRGDLSLARVLVDASRDSLASGGSRHCGRGLPDDLSPALRTLISSRESLEWMCNYPSWMLLQELLEIPWSKLSEETRGFVNAEQYVVFGRTGRPECFASTVVAEPAPPAAPSGWMDRIRRFFGLRPRNAFPPQIVSTSEMEQLIADGRFSTGAVTQIACQTPYAENFHVFLNQTLPLLGTFGTPNSVRIVFWF